MTKIFVGNTENFEIGIKELFLVLWSDKVKIASITMAFAVFSVFYALSIPNQYRATALLAPAKSDGGGLSSALGQLGGLASLAGVSIGEGTSSEAEIAHEIMNSWSFVEEFIDTNDLAINIYAARDWDHVSGELEIDDSLYDLAKNEWLIEAGETDSLRAPTSWELFQKFSNMLSVSQDNKSGLVTISIEYFSPQIAKEWVDLFVAAINEHMQRRQIEKVAKNISYLEDQISKTSIAEMQEVFYTLIEEQIKNRMVAEASPDYAFVTVSPSMVPEENSKPNRALICVFLTMLGGVLGVFLSLGLYFLRANSND